MLILNPVAVKKIWGTDRIFKYSCKKSKQKVGSNYSVIAQKKQSNTIISKEYYGMKLYDLILDNPVLFGLKKNEVFPVMIAITGADQGLSIQVHPTDKYAQKKENMQYGKCESWYFIEAPTDGYIYSGTSLEDKEEIRDLITQGEVERVVDHLDVCKNDLVFIPPGTLHALTKGSLIYEIQQSTDITYRFYDFNRLDQDGKKRELHLEKALETLCVKNKSEISPTREGEDYKNYAYNLKLVKFTDSTKITNDSEIAQVYSLIKGKLKVVDYEIKQGMSFLLMPNECLKVDGNAELIIATCYSYWR
ncbi:MAG: type I phosphomannose isomerase catalytic subunit [Eubacteriales bacterium]